MKKILLALTLVSLLALPGVGLAAVCGNGLCEIGESAATCPSDCEAPSLPVVESLNRVINWVFVFLLIAATISILIAAYQFVTAAGDPTKVATARQYVIYAIIGVVVALLARGIVILVNTILR